MEGAYAKELYQLEAATQVLLLRDLLPRLVHVPHGNPEECGFGGDA